jgi:NADH-quinone oxidoreductase subunit C
MSAEHGAAAGDKQPEAPLPIGQFGQFLKDHGIESTRSADSVGVETIEIKASDLTGALRLLKSSSEVSLDLLLTISGVDTDTSYDSVYHLWSYENLNELVLKVRCDKAALATAQLPTVTSVTPFWPAANWHERETYDLVGIKYTGHPYLRRILNPWDWDGYPLRRDYRQLIDALNNKNPHSFR